MAKLPVSCFIISKNEADRIAQTIRSVSSWVDEVIVVDSESTDDTVPVAISEGCRVITQPWLGFGPQKRFAEEQCRNDWLLNLDADEVVTPALKEEIISVFGTEPPANVAYAIPLNLVYPKAVQPRPWARDHLYVRLYDRRTVRFRNSHVHDTVVTEDHPVGVLRSPAYHYSFRTYDDLKQKLSKRMLLSAEHARPLSKTKLLLRLAFELPINFFKYYVVRRHFTGGFDGLRFSWIQATYRRAKVAHMWRYRALEEKNGPQAGDREAPRSKTPDFELFIQSPSTSEVYPERA
jgi:glycosyltransferase involved in cell wall biosynthesis